MCCIFDGAVVLSRQAWQGPNSGSTVVSAAGDVFMRTVTEFEFVRDCGFDVYSPELPRKAPCAWFEFRTDRIAAVVGIVAEVQGRRAGSRNWATLKTSALLTSHGHFGVDVPDVAEVWRVKLSPADGIRPENLLSCARGQAVWRTGR